MIVVDATVLADLLFGAEESREAALRLQGLDPEWICVGLTRYEVGNVAWKMARISGLDSEVLRPGLEGMEGLLVKVEDEIDALRVLEIAVNHAISYYDGAHVWLAISRGLPLYSRDGALRRKCPEVVRAMPTS